MVVTGDSNLLYGFSGTRGKTMNKFGIRSYSSGLKF